MNDPIWKVGDRVIVPQIPERILTVTAVRDRNGNQLVSFEGMDGGWFGSSSFVAAPADAAKER